MGKLKVVEPAFLAEAEEGLTKVNNALQGEIERRKTVGGRIAARTEGLEIMRRVVMELLRTVRIERER